MLGCPWKATFQSKAPICSATYVAAFAPCFLSLLTFSGLFEADLVRAFSTSCAASWERPKRRAWHFTAWFYSAEMCPTRGRGAGEGTRCGAGRNEEGFQVSRSCWHGAHRRRSCPGATTPGRTSSETGDRTVVNHLNVGFGAV